MWFFNCRSFQWGMLSFFMWLHLSFRSIFFPDYLEEGWCLRIVSVYAFYKKFSVCYKEKAADIVPIK
jgi:hypothetical protein